jgi:hypothetical protein
MILCAQGLEDVPVFNFPCPHLIPDPLVAYACGRVHGCKHTVEAGELLEAILGEKYFVYTTPRHISIHSKNPDNLEMGPRLAMFVDTNQDDSLISVNGESLTLERLMSTVDASALV